MMGLIVRKHITVRRQGGLVERHYWGWYLFGVIPLVIREF